MKRSAVLVLVVGAAVLVLGATSPVLLRWSRERDPDRRLGPAPTIAGDECGVGRPPGALLALDAATGALRWSRMVGGGGTGANRPTGVAVADGTVALTVEGAGIAAFATSDGSHRWCAGGAVVTSVADRLFTVQDGVTVELEPRSGRPTPGRGEVLARLLEAAAGDVTVEEQDAPYPRHARELWAHDRAGTELWAAEVPGFDIAVADRFVVVIDQSDGTGELDSRPGHVPTHVRFTAYDLSSGEQAWSVRTAFTSTLVLAGDRFVTQPGGNLMVREVATGHLVWERRYDNPGRTGRFSEPGMVVAAAADPASGALFVLLASEAPYRD